MAFLRRRSKSAVEIHLEAEVTPPPPMAEATPRQQCRVRGTVTRMKSRPASVGLPSLAVQVSDDSGTVIAVWTGRRSLGGLKLGGVVELEGVPILVDGKLEFLNPMYTLVPAEAP